MWPWEHVAVGYVLVSAYYHARYRRGPHEAAALAAVFGAAFPDLVDKPLSWGLGLFPQGYAVAHSVLVWIVLVAAVFVLAPRLDRAGVAAAFGLGYGSHLAGDVLFPALLGGRLAFERVLWPLVTLPPYEHQLGLLARTTLYVRRLLEYAMAGGLGPALVFEVGLMLLVAVLWLYDGRPGIGLLRLGREDRGGV